MTTNATLNRRNLMLVGGAALAGAASSRPAFAAHKTGPGGFSPEGLAKITKTLQSYVDDEAVVGHMTLLYRHGQIAQVNALGWQDREAKIPMARNTIFRMASMTKPITGVAALTLMEQGKIGLYDPISKWLPELANPKVLNNPNGPLNDTHAAPRAITLADLLTHRSGIVGQFNTGPVADAYSGIRPAGSDPTFDEWLKALGAIPLAYDPGSAFNYGTSFDVLGALVQRISGKPYGEYLKATIFDPLGMKDTGFWLPQEKQGRLAAIYTRDPQTGKQVAASRPVPTAPTNFVSGAGGLVSTADDYLQFAKVLLNKGRSGDVRLLSHPTVAMMTTNWLTPEQRKTGAMGRSDFWASQGFGLSVSITDDVSQLGPNPYSSKGAFGWNGATGVSWKADPLEDMIPIYMVQNGGNPTAAIRAAAEASPAAPPPSSPAAPPPSRANTVRRTPPVVAFFNTVYEAIEV